jgi:uncharacterized protein
VSNRIITRLDLIEQLSRRRAGENARFRTLVKQSPIADAELDSIVEETGGEVERQIDCTACGNCCRTLQVVVDDTDIRRLARGLCLPPRELERRYVKQAPDGVKHMARTPCPFLEGNRCSVYEDRPKSCRDFPYLRADGFRKRMLVMIDNASTCPIVFNTLEELKQKLK